MSYGRHEILYSFLELASRPHSAPTIDISMWYKKKNNIEEVLQLCGIEAEFKTVALYVHEDDIGEIQKFLDVTDDCMDLLFERRQDLL